MHALPMSPPGQVLELLYQGEPVALVDHRGGTPAIAFTRTAPPYLRAKVHELYPAIRRGNAQILPWRRRRA